MKIYAVVLVVGSIIACSHGFNISPQKPFNLVPKEMIENAKKAVVVGATAITLVTSGMDQTALARELVTTPQQQTMITMRTPTTGITSSSNIVAEKVVRQGLYKDYEVDIVQEYDDARSTFKPAKETKTKKGKYTAILAILVVGSFVIPMAQYFWYVRDDDSSDKFFAAASSTPEPEEPPKKKGWFS